MNKITIYTTNSCHFCHAAKDFFDKKSIQYTEKNVEQDKKAREDMMEKTGQMSVPVIDINGQIIVGFDEGAIEKAIA